MRLMAVTPGEFLAEAAAPPGIGQGLPKGQKATRVRTEEGTRQTVGHFVAPAQAGQVLALQADQLVRRVVDPHADFVALVG